MEEKHTLVNIILNEQDTLKLSELPILQRLYLHDQLYAVWLPMNERNEHPLVSLLKTYPNFERKKPFLAKITNDSLDAAIYYPIYLKHYLSNNRVYTRPIQSLKIVKTARPSGRSRTSRSGTKAARAWAACGPRWSC